MADYYVDIPLQGFSHYSEICSFLRDDFPGHYRYRIIYTWRQWWRRKFHSGSGVKFDVTLRLFFWDIETALYTELVWLHGVR